ncbi:hypothetical protein L7F22_046993 [Adiantum nelumboides]|nr:hypothetical protein [Adiantum nelumboides]
MESDAKKSEAFQPYNILPLEARGVSDAILNFPEVIAARVALQCPALQFSSEMRSPLQKWDVLDVLQLAFGFQHDNVRNQREHLVLLLANGQTQLGGMPGPSEQGLHVDVINKLCTRVLGNYEKWCHYIRKQPVHARRNSSEEKVAFLSLYFLIWGEAANVRFLPEALCYIFHNMGSEFALMLDNKRVEEAVSCKSDNGQSFLDQIVTPLYIALKAEASNGGKSGHSKWRNYDDFNEFFWSYSCFKELGWPMNYKSTFFGNAMDVQGSRRRRLGKTSFVEHRTFLHLYHSFLRTWILLILMFQGLTIIAFTEGFNRQRLKILLSLGLTYFVMKLIESALDLILMVGAYTSSRGNAITRIFSQFVFFGGCTGGFFFLYLKMMLEDDARSTFFNIYLLALGIFVALQLIISFFLHIPALRKQAEKSDRIKCFEAIKWLYQERYFVGRGLFESPPDYLRYVIFWIAVLGCKFTFSFFLQIKPLVDATTAITSFEDVIVYTWHDFFSKSKFLSNFFLCMLKLPRTLLQALQAAAVCLLLLQSAAAANPNLFLMRAWFVTTQFRIAQYALAVGFLDVGSGGFLLQLQIIIVVNFFEMSIRESLNVAMLYFADNHNALAVLFLWAPVVVIYLLDISVWYTIISAVLGGLLGARDRLGEIRSPEMFRNRFESFPEGFVNSLEHRKSIESRTEIPEVDQNL